MTNFSDWKKNQKKRNPNLSYAEIIRLGGRKKWYDQTPPEWLWYLIFCGFIIALGIMIWNIDRIKPQEVKIAQEAYLVPSEVKMPLAEEMTAKSEVVGVADYVDGDQEPRYLFRQSGVASYYDYELPGDKIGEEWSKSHDTCATRGWNRYGKMKVTNLDNGKSVVCYVNDDGPRDCAYRYKYKLDKPGECIERLVDMSSHAFKQIADTKLGLINVSIEEIN